MNPASRVVWRISRSTGSRRATAASPTGPAPGRCLSRQRTTPMPYVVTQSCCSDASCVYACPVNCIHPTPDEPDFLTAEMLHIDPAACVDCGACVSACPVDAIVPHSADRSAAAVPEINAEFYRAPRDGTAGARAGLPAPSVRDRTPLRVAIVGSGPAAMYAADELLTQPGVQVNVFETASDAVRTGPGRCGAGPSADQAGHAAVRQIADQAIRVLPQRRGRPAVQARRSVRAPPRGGLRRRRVL